MNMRKMLLCCLCLCSSFVFCQSIRLTSDIGYSITKLSKEKRIGFYRGLGLGLEKYLSNNWYLEFLPNTYTIQFSASNSLGQNTFTSIRFIGLNVEAKKYMLITAKSRIYLALGLYADNLFSRKLENNSLSTEVTHKNSGYNFGLSSAVGIRTILSRAISFDIGIADQEDYLFRYDNPDDKVANSRRSLKISFYLQSKQ
jgi:hypothetical protein